MSIITASILKTHPASNDLFVLDVKVKKRFTKIRMKMIIPLLSTERMPNTIEILKAHLPSILRSKCFNENNYSFSKEVKKTEIGHLFEHMILEYLSLIKISESLSNPIHNGFTDWNWIKDERGVFHITLDAGVEDKYVLSRAISRSAELLNQIIRLNYFQINSQIAQNTLPVKD